MHGPVRTLKRHQLVGRLDVLVVYDHMETTGPTNTNTAHHRTLEQAR